MRTALILNPAAGASNQASHAAEEEELPVRLLNTLRELGMDAEIYYTDADDPGQGIAKKLAAEQVELIVAVGGDGTIHSVAHGIMGSDSILGVIPAGTMNNLAHSLGIPTDIEAACAVLTEGRVYTVDIGSINQHPFLEVAGVGLEAALFPAAEEVKSHNFLSTIKGIVGGLWTLIMFRPPRVRVTFEDEKPRTYRAIQITVCNAPYYGAHLSIAPDIFLNDGWLDVFLYTNFSKSEFLRHAFAISQGRRPFMPGLLRRRVKKVRFSTQEPVELQADGVAQGFTPAHIEIHSMALRVQAPVVPGSGLLAGEKAWTPSAKDERKQTYV